MAIGKKEGSDLKKKNYQTCACPISRTVSGLFFDSGKYGLGGFCLIYAPSFLDLDKQTTFLLKTYINDTRYFCFLLLLNCSYGRVSKTAFYLC